MQPNHQNKTKKVMFLLLGEEESVGPVSAFPTDIVQNKIVFFERAHNSHLIDIFYHRDSCCHEVDL